MNVYTLFGIKKFRVGVSHKSKLTSLLWGDSTDAGDVRHITDFQIKGIVPPKILFDWFYTRCFLGLKS